MVVEMRLMTELSKKRASRKPVMDANDGLVFLMATTIMYIIETLYLSRLDSIHPGLTQLCENVEYYREKSSPSSLLVSFRFFFSSRLSSPLSLFPPLCRR